MQSLQDHQCRQGAERRSGGEGEAAAAPGGDEHHEDGVDRDHERERGDHDRRAAQARGPEPAERREVGRDRRAGMGDAVGGHPEHRRGGHEEDPRDPGQAPPVQTSGHHRCHRVIVGGGASTIPPYASEFDR